MDDNKLRGTEEKKYLLWIISIGFMLPFVIYAFVDYFRNGCIIKDNLLIFYGTILGACFTGIITAGGLYITVNQTRKIQKENMNMQERLIKIEENKQKQELRTNFQEFLIESDIELKKYERTLTGSMLILTEDYRYINSVLDNGKEYFEINTKIVKGVLTRFDNIAQLDSEISALKTFNRYLFKAIKNVGKNPMYNVGIKMNGLWFNAHNKENKSGDIEISIDFIGIGDTVLIPIFKLDEKVKLWQFKPERNSIYYHTELSGKRERITTKTIYLLSEQKISRTIYTCELDENEVNKDSSFIEYKII